MLGLAEVGEDVMPVARRGTQRKWTLRMDGLSLSSIRIFKLLHTNPKYHSSDDTLLVAMRGTKDDEDGVSDKIMELVQTS
jgi:hypothetical protein